MRDAISRTRRFFAERALSRELDAFLTAQQRYEQRLPRLLTRLTGSDGMPVPSTVLPAVNVHHVYSGMRRVADEFATVGRQAENTASMLRAWSDVTERTTEDIRGGEVYLGHFGPNEGTFRIVT